MLSQRGLCTLRARQGWAQATHSTLVGVHRHSGLVPLHCCPQGLEAGDRHVSMLSLHVSILGLAIHFFKHTL